MATDWWPEQSGRLTDGLTIMCTVGASSVTEGGAVTFGVSALSTITVIGAASQGDGWGVAMKTESTAGVAVPVVVYGLYKMTTSNGTSTVVTQGSFVMNSVATGISVMGSTATTNLKTFNGTSYILGMAMQSSTANGDSIVVFIGKAA